MFKLEQGKIWAAQIPDKRIQCPESMRAATYRLDVYHGNAEEPTEKQRELTYSFMWAFLTPKINAHAVIGFHDQDAPDPLNLGMNMEFRYCRWQDSGKPICVHFGKPNTEKHGSTILRISSVVYFERILQRLEPVAKRWDVDLIQGQQALEQLLPLLQDLELSQDPSDWER